MNEPKTDPQPAPDTPPAAQPPFNNGAPQPAAAQSSASAGAGPGKPPTPSSAHRRQGKVAQLSKATRHSISLMIEDGVTYRKIRDNLGEEGKDLTHQNISEYKRGGHQDWLREQAWLREMRRQQETALELLRNHDEAKLHQVVLQIALTQAFQNLRSLIPDNLNGKFDTDPIHYTRFLNAVCRLSREALVFRKYDDICARTVAEELEKLDINRDISDNEYELLGNRMDHVFHMPRPASLNPQPTQPVTPAPAPPIPEPATLPPTEPPSA